MDSSYYLHSETAEVERTIGEDETDRHSVISVSSSESSVADPVNYEVASIASSVEERLT